MPPRKGLPAYLARIPLLVPSSPPSLSLSGSRAPSPLRTSSSQRQWRVYVRVCVHLLFARSTLEFEDHRPLYEWVIGNLPVPATPRQIEFSRLNLQYCVVSKRKLI